MHVRRSPFEPELIDIKFFDERGMDISANREKGVERLFFREDFRRAKVEDAGRLSFPEYDVEHYREGILGFINQDAIRARAPKVVIDYAYGSASTIFPHILGKVGCQVIALNAYMDEDRIVKTGDEFQQSLKQLVRDRAHPGGRPGVHAGRRGREALPGGRQGRPGVGRAWRWPSWRSWWPGRSRPARSACPSRRAGSWRSWPRRGASRSSGPRSRRAP
ncbi:MAG: hypothetical protein MZV64_70605 [Ignavibacteriales bacterium]|nr:hypothetical protein [Ignavibacteriales bacterium]